MSLIILPVVTKKFEDLPSCPCTASVTLLTPKTGEETRSILKRNAEEKMPELREKAQWIREKAAERAPEIRERAEELAALARDRGIAAVEEIRAATKGRDGDDPDDNTRNTETV